MNGTSVQDMHKFCNEITRQFGRIRQNVIADQLNDLQIQILNVTHAGWSVTYAGWCNHL